MSPVIQKWDFCKWSGVTVGCEQGKGSKVVPGVWVHGAYTLDFTLPGTCESHLLSGPCKLCFLNLKESLSKRDCLNLGEVSAHHYSIPSPHPGGR